MEEKCISVVNVITDKLDRINIRRQAFQARSIIEEVKDAKQGNDE